MGIWSIWNWNIPSNDTIIGDAKGYFFNNLSSSWFNNNYPGFPGYWVIEGNIIWCWNVEPRMQLLN